MKWLPRGECIWNSLSISVSVNILKQHRSSGCYLACLTSLKVRRENLMFPLVRYLRERDWMLKYDGWIISRIPSDLLAEVNQILLLISPKFSTCKHFKWITTNHLLIMVDIKTVIHNCGLQMKCYTFGAEYLLSYEQSWELIKDGADRVKF